MTPPRTIKRLACTCPVCGEQWVVSHTGRGRRRCPACHFSGPTETFAHRRLPGSVPAAAPDGTAEPAERPADTRGGHEPSSRGGSGAQLTLGERLKRILG